MTDEQTNPEETTETITRVDERNRYILTVDGEEAGYIEFDDMGDVIDMPHTVVDERFGGRGYGGLLVKHALDDARERGMKVEPTCPYIDRWIEKHPDYEDLRA